MRQPEKTCAGCRWLYDWFWICCNGDSEDRGDTPTRRCELYEPLEDGEDGIDPFRTV